MGWVDVNWCLQITDFLQQFGLPLEELEPLGSNCTEVHVWKAHTEHGARPDAVIQQLGHHGWHD